MKRTTWIATASALALLAWPAVAQTEEPASRTGERTGEAAENAAERTGEAAGNAAERTGEAAENAAERTGEAAEDTGSAVGDALGSANRTVTRTVEQAGDAIGVTFRSEAEIYGEGATTAAQLTGLRVAGRSREDIATVADILVDRDGKAQRAILSDGGFLGLGARYVAVPYDSIRPVMEDGELDHVRIDETQEDLQNRRAFAYSGASDGDAETLPPGTFSVEEMIGSGVDGADGDRVAVVRDVVFDKKGRARAAVLDVGGFLGAGAKAVAVDFSDLQVAQGDADLVIRADRAALEGAPSVPVRTAAEDRARGGTDAEQPRNQPQSPAQQNEGESR